MVDTPDSNRDYNDAAGNLDNTRATPQAADAAQPDSDQRKPQQAHEYAEDVVRALKALGSATVDTVNWIDTKGPFVAALATVAIAVLTGIYVHYSRAMWKTMRDELPELRESADAARGANETARSNLTGSNRPWMGVDGHLVVLNPVKISHPRLNPTEPPQTQVQTAASFTLKNFGRDPAFYVTAYVDIVTTQHAAEIEEWMDDFRREARATCAMADLRSRPFIPGEKGSGPTVFPGSELPVVNFPLNTTSPTQRTDASLTIVGCISYRDQFKETPTHHTGFCFTSYSPMTTVAAGQSLSPCGMNQGAD
jgi:hypothetical protein